MISGTSERTTMSQGDVSAPRTFAAAEIAPRLHRILVATDGSSASDGALRLARIVSRQGEIPVEVLSVLDPAVTGMEHVLPDAFVGEVERRFARVHTQVNSVTGRKPDWRTSIDIGPIPETISRLADGRGADLIVVGFGQHRRMRDRPPDKATVRRIAELSSTPVFVVPSHAHDRPANAMLALDFSRSSLRAARAALAVMDTPGVMHLVYVHTTYEPFPAAPPDPDLSYAAGFASFFEAVERELDAPAGISFERVVIQLGDIVSELLAYAEVNGVDLIAVGNHGKTRREERALGSVSAGILRSAQCSVVVSGSGGSAADQADDDAQAATIPSRGDR